MILSGKEIERLQGEEIHIDPFLSEQLNPNSYNLRLHDELLVYQNQLLDMKQDNPVEKVLISQEGLIFQPRYFQQWRCIVFLSSRSKK